MNGAVTGLRGTLLEAEDVPPGRRLSVWRVGGCVLGDVEVAPQTVITVCAGTRTMLFDETAPPDQVLALFDVLRDHVGDRASGAGDDWRFIQIPIDERMVNGVVSVSVPGRLQLVTRRGAPPAAPALLADISLSLPDHGVEWRAEHVPVTVRDFDWTRPIDHHGGVR